jgi:hypothetical protein
MIDLDTRLHDAAVAIARDPSANPRLARDPIGVLETAGFADLVPYVSELRGRCVELATRMDCDPGFRSAVRADPLGELAKVGLPAMLVDPFLFALAARGALQDGAEWDVVAHAWQPALVGVLAVLLFAGAAPVATPHAAAAATSNAVLIVDTTAVQYPGDDADKADLAKWMAARAAAAGLPPELPVMAALVESNLENLTYGDSDSAGFFAMQSGTYGREPELQLAWFVERAVDVKRERIAAGAWPGEADYVGDASRWDEWIAAVERRERHRGRYQVKLDETRSLIASRTS